MDVNHVRSPVGEAKSANKNRFRELDIDTRSESSNLCSSQQSYAGWDGTMTLYPQSCSDPASSDCKSPRSDYSISRTSPHRVIKKQDCSSEDLDSSESEEYENKKQCKRSISSYQPNMVKSISSKYRFGALVNKASKYRAIPSKTHVPLSKLTLGVLVWALLPPKFQVPWWPGIVVGSRSAKQKNKDGKDVCYYRIMLIHSPSHLEDIGWFFITRKNLRILKTREAFEAFMQGSLLQVFHKPNIISNFVVPTHQEQAWVSAREKLMSMEMMSEKSLVSRLRCLGLDLSSLRKVWKTEDEDRKKRLTKLKESGIVKRKGDKRHTTPVRRQPETLPKNEFAFKSLLHVFKGNALGRFICCVCLKPGRFLPKSKNKKEGLEEDEETEAAEEHENGEDDSDEEEDQGERGKKTKPNQKPKLHVSSSLPANHVKTATKAQKLYAGKLAELEAASMQAWPVLMPCAGRCPNYLHLDCAAPEDQCGDWEEGQEPPKVFCRLCKEGLSQCCLCLEVQPAQVRSRARRDEQVLRQCAASNCRRRFHRNICLRRPPHELLVHDGCAETFNCPAHTCMSCYAETPGIWPHPTSYFIHCFLCPATFHADEWCVPAGSLWLSRYWIVCSRHANQVQPQSLLRLPSRVSQSRKLQESQLGIKSISLNSRPLPPPTLNAVDRSSSLPSVEPSAMHDGSPIDASDADEKPATKPPLPLYKQLPYNRILPSNAQRPLLVNWFRPTNISWCLICSRAGEIVCCEGCPSSFHLKCLHVDDVEDQFFCEDCTNGRVPRYGEIVWVRVPPLGHPQIKTLLNGLPSNLRFLQHTFPPEDVHKDLKGVRWWPGEILHHRSLRIGGPNSADFCQIDRPERLGFFVVRLFGLFSATPFNGIKPRDAAATLASARALGGRDNRLVFPVCLWTTQARVFYFEEGDAEMEQNSDDGDDNADGVTLPAETDNRNVNDNDKNDLGSSDEESMAEEDPIMPTLLSPTPLSSRLSKTLSSPVRADRIPSSPSSARRVERKSGEKYRECRRKRLAVQWREAYLSATRMAGEGLAARKATRSETLKNSDDHPDYYEYIKTNRAIGSVRIRRCTDLSEVPQCECTSSEHCGPNSGCVNRSLLYECLASVCVHGKSCRNQFFTRRQYPKQIVFYTGKERGWGLKTGAAIQKGEFVNEYVGDLIDEAEANRRLTSLHKNNIHSFYMMQMDSQRIIDAGPKGNLSRFMNHSCCPNLFTQKWTVNGDTRIGLFALRDIAPDEELTFNYNFCSLGQEMKVCFCGAETCVGYLGARPDHSSVVNATSVASNSASTTESAHSAQDRNCLGVTSHKQKKASDLKKKSSPSSSTSSTAAATAPVAFTNTILKGNRGETKFSTSSLFAKPIKKYSFASKINSRCYRCSKTVSNPIEVNSYSPPSSSSLADSSGLNKSKRRRSVDEALTLVKASVPTSTNRTTITGVICSQLDCRKVYHISCLSLKAPPSGRWVCPWHHCDACGRPSTVFCQRCTTSFCHSHVEGSVAALPPLIPGGFAQIVCLSHTELIASYSNQNDSGSDSEVEEGNDEEEEIEGEDGIEINGFCSRHLLFSNAESEDDEEGSESTKKATTGIEDVNRVGQKRVNNSPLLASSAFCKRPRSALSSCQDDGQSY